MHEKMKQAEQIGEAEVLRRDWVNVSKFASQTKLIRQRYSQFKVGCCSVSNDVSDDRDGHSICQGFFSASSKAV